MSRRPDRCDLAPPTNIVLASRSVLGSIDLDPYSTKEINTLVQSAKIFDRNDGEDALHKIISQDWYTILKKNQFTEKEMENSFRDSVTISSQIGLNVAVYYFQYL